MGSRWASGVQLAVECDESSMLGLSHRQDIAVASGPFIDSVTITAVHCLSEVSYSAMGSVIGSGATLTGQKTTGAAWQLSCVHEVVVSALLLSTRIRSLCCRGCGLHVPFSCCRSSHCF
jgi:hypothetical protein